MKKCLFVLVLIGALCSPAFAQSNDEKTATRQLLEKYFATYTRPLSKTQQGELLNRVALERPGWKLLGKKSGNNCPMPNGTLISCDFLVYGPTVRGWDVISSEGSVDSRIVGPNGAGEDMSGAVANGSRIIENPVTSTGPVEPPPVDLDLIRAALNQALTRIFELSTHVSQLRQNLENVERQLSMLNGRVDEANGLSGAAQAGVINLSRYLKDHPVPDGCRVRFIGCGLTFTAPPLE